MKEYANETQVDENRRKGIDKSKRSNNCTYLKERFPFNIMMGQWAVLNYSIQGLDYGLHVLGFQFGRRLMFCTQLQRPTFEHKAFLTSARKVMSLFTVTQTWHQIYNIQALSSLVMDVKIVCSSS